MCRFKSGIILKNKIVIAPEDNESHSDLLEILGIKDDYIGASKTFVRAELVPKKDDEWWIDPAEKPEKWVFVVDQDIIPDWFDKETHEKEFRESVCDWWRKHVLVDKKLEELKTGFYRLKRCEVKKLLNDVRVMLDSSQVGEMWGSSQVGEMRGSSQVGEMWSSSQVGEMRGSSQVGEMWGSSQVGKMRDSSQVGKMWGSSQVGKMRGSSQVGEMWDSSQVGKMLGSSQVGEMRGSSQVGEMWDSSQVGEMRGSSQVGEMRGSSQVGKMWGSSQVGEMWGSSTARDFKNYPVIKIMIPDGGKFEMVVHKNKDDE